MIRLSALWNRPALPNSPAPLKSPALLNSIGARLLLLLLVAESPLVAFTVGVLLQNDRLEARDALSRTAAAQQNALAALAGDVRLAEIAATAAGSLPAELIRNRGECDSVLASLVTANTRVGSIALTNAAGAIACATPGAPPVETEPAPPSAPASLRVRAATLYVAAGSASSPAGLVHVRLTPDPAAPGRPAIWLAQAGRWLPIGTATAAEAPADPLPLWAAAGKAVRLPAQDGRPYLYSAIPVPAGLGAAADRFVAGSDIRSAATAASRTYALRMTEMAAFFLSEFLLIAAGVSLVASRPLRRLIAEIDRWRAGSRFDGLRPADGPAEVRALSQSFTQATTSLDLREQELRSSIAQQELLMQEIHHRVKNNLQIIASLLNLQASRIKAPEARAEFQSARDRVRALATLHRHLYATGELHMIDMRAFFAELCSQLFQAAGEVEGDRIALEIAAPDVAISSDQAVPIALIVTETVGNSLKYAFPHHRRGLIHVGFKVGPEGSVELKICDDGIGITDRPEADDRPPGLGLQLVRGFARQLGAQLTVTDEPGTCYVLAMKIERHRKDPAPPDSPRPGSPVAPV